MNDPQHASIDGRVLRLDQSLCWWDRDTDCQIVVSQPATDPKLWRSFLNGATHSYRKHGVECALDIDAVQGGADTAFFWSAIDATGEVVAGVRAKGPLRSAEDSHAVVEWSGRPGEHAIRKMITDRVPFGVIEMKSAWIAEGAHGNGGLAKVIARSGFHAMEMLGIQFCMATGATQVLQRWRSSGGVLAAAIPATPYPDERYRTKMMWWDRNNFVRHAEPEQVSKILIEIGEVGRRLQEAGGASATRKGVL